MTRFLRAKVTVGAELESPDEGHQSWRPCSWWELQPPCLLIPERRLIPGPGPAVGKKSQHGSLTSKDEAVQLPEEMLGSVQ